MLLKVILFDKRCQFVVEQWIDIFYNRIISETMEMIIFAFYYIRLCKDMCVSCLLEIFSWNKLEGKLWTKCNLMVKTCLVLNESQDQELKEGFDASGVCWEYCLNRCSDEWLLDGLNFATLNRKMNCIKYY